MIYQFQVGRLSCAVVSDGQMEPPLAPPLEAFFTPGTGVPERELREALAAEGQGRTMVRCGYNCLLVETPDGQAVIDTGLGPRFGGYGPRIRADGVRPSRWGSGRSEGPCPSGVGLPRNPRAAGGAVIGGGVVGGAPKSSAAGGRGELSPPRGRC